MSLRSRFRDVNGVVFALVAVFAFSSWIDLYGVYVQLPLLVNHLPEGWGLPSYLGVISTMANVGPLLYALTNLLCPRSIKTKETFTIYFIISTGAVVCVLMSFFWNRTAHVLGQERSVALFAMVLFLALVDCTSCVVYLPFMSRLKAVYMPSYVAGEEMGGMISGLVGLAQGAGGEVTCLNGSKVIYNETLGENYTVTYIYPQQTPPRFSVSTFFLFLFGMMCLSGVAFTLLNFAPFCKKEMVSNEEYSKVSANDKEITKEAGNFNGKAAVPNGSITQEADNNAGKTTSPFRFYYAVFLFAYAAFFMYGLVPAVLSYAALPYGSFAYTLSIRLSTVVNPIAAFSTFVLQTSSLVAISLCMAVANSISFFVIYLASMSPDPPLVGTVGGQVMVVLLGVTSTCFYSFSRTSVATLLRKEAGHRGLLWAGFSVQMGACLGTVLGFVLVNVLHVFKDKPLCPGM